MARDNDHAQDRNSDDLQSVKRNHRHLQNSMQVNNLRQIDI